ncbi:FlgB family protein [uncultured Roseovarius sp.]|uniref:FlgB family protein n=1 Tax=uncultured Roseovarius sp. TaxID=293344 RepID=UPI00260A1554|nr:FlgB family protein [uncultured Roseovarius sp.]
MFEKLEIFRIANALATHAGARQSVVAQNMANADTPDYIARDVKPFKEIIEGGDSGFVPRATRSGHLHAATLPFDMGIAKMRDVETDPNGNSVSLETEMMKAVDVKRDHDRALAIYKSSLTVLRSALGRR